MTVASLLVRNLEPELVERLKRRAAEHGRSAEAEHRELLRAALAPELDGQQLFDRLRRGSRLEADVDPDAWRLPDEGEPAEL